MARGTKSYSEMMSELQSLLAEMQSDVLDVDAAIADYERARELLAELEVYLQTAENKIVRYKGDADMETS